MFSSNDRVVVAAAVEETDREDVVDALRCRDSVLEALENSGYRAVPLDISPEDLDNPSLLVKRITKEHACCVFNLFEGFSKAAFLEVAFAKLLEVSGVPFTGNRSRALAACLDKKNARTVLRNAGLPVPPGTCICSMSERERLEGLSFPLFVKPRCEDSSVGVDSESVVQDQSKLEQVLRHRLEEFPQGVIVEEYLHGEECNASCMGIWPYDFLAMSRILYRPEKGTSDFLGYDSKWRPESVDYREIESRVEEGVPSRLQYVIKDMAIRAGAAMSCDGYFRVDFRERDGKWYVLEVNPNPDINTDSGFARQSEEAGYSYRSMVAKLVELAVERGDHGVHHNIGPKRRIAVH